MIFSNSFNQSDSNSINNHHPLSAATPPLTAYAAAASSQHNNSSGRILVWFHIFCILIDSSLDLLNSILMNWYASMTKRKLELLENDNHIFLWTLQYLQ